MLISHDSRLSFEKSQPGRLGFSLPSSRCVSPSALSRIPEKLRRQKPILFPEMTEPEVVRHFVQLSKKNYCVDSHFYPLGSCTMKYNPKVNEWAARRPEFTDLHPFQPEATCQGLFHILYELECDLKEITGMTRFTLEPAAGAHGELTGMMLVRAYHDDRSDDKRRKVLVPDSSHGTNPASAALLGYHVVEIKSDARGRVDLDSLKQNLDDETACLMLTNPNTLGLFEENVLEIARLVHEKGALLYYDGANLNALLGLARPADMGFDIVHLNLHKTFSTPHGGGGPGAGPVGVNDKLAAYLPNPVIEKVNDTYCFQNAAAKSIGRVKAFYGNVGVLLRAFVYIRSMGLSGLKAVAEASILNANYMKEKLKKVFPVGIDEPCLHEFVLSMKGLQGGVHAGDVGKRLLDYGFHAPTVHFPLVVAEALMIEPTETETKETLDQFIDAMMQIAREIRENPDQVKHAPWALPIRRPDEVLAARKPTLSFRDVMKEKILQAEGIPT